jgi:spore maturation protein CgeB
VDYYARLPGIYARARYSLCLTSLQLPQGLNQRHFDIWMAGGLCLTDASPGLDLFPRELTRPVTFRAPGDIARITRELERAGNREALIASWREHLLERHTYAHRVRDILERVGARSCPW